MKSLNEEISRIKSMMNHLDEQKCRRGTGYGCHGNSKTPDGAGIFKKGSGVPLDGKGEMGPVEDTVSKGSDFTEISNFSTYDEDDKSSILSSYERDKTLLPVDVKPPSKKTKPDYYTAAWRDANRFNIKNANTEFTKFFNPTTGDFINPENRSKFIGADIYFPFYKHYFANKQKITPIDIINLYKDKLGGIDKFVNISSTGYKIP